MRRNVITIDEEKCTGCSLCIPNCPEGAIQIIDGKARLVSDLMCDGLGACLGHCPEGAISIIEREADAYDERKVMANIVKQGENTIAAHLKHLSDHQQHQYYQEAVRYLNENNIPVPEIRKNPRHGGHSGGCPGSKALSFDRENSVPDTMAGKRPSQLNHWPVQLHLISPNSAHYQGSDMVLAADCVAFAMGDFHKEILKGKTLAIACPKLDDGQDIYLEKIRALIDIATINTLTVIIMQVPCCSGLLNLAQKAAQMASRKIPIKVIVVGMQGQILKEEWV